ncbi:hypothetical protein BaRGS_00039106 [Batillaria attramentaria]|uniref:Uncharacterized protein n=1 Tax=Batillaria attramentaria TaxID=370345 RepID=A0ABD0J408_9CAEN
MRVLGVKKHTSTVNLDISKIHTGHHYQQHKPACTSSGQVVHHSRFVQLLENHISSQREVQQSPISNIRLPEADSVRMKALQTALMSLPGPISQCDCYWGCPNQLHAESATRA